MQKALLYEQGQQVLHNLVWQLSHYTAINYAHLNLEFCHFMSHKSLNMHAEEGSHWHIAGFEAGFEAFAWIACATDENGCWLSQSVKSLFWVCPHLCNKIWVSATTGMHVKRAIVNLPSGWKENQNTLSLIWRVGRRLAQNKDLGTASQTLFTSLDYVSKAGYCMHCHCLQTADLSVKWLVTSTFFPLPFQ